MKKNILLLSLLICAAPTLAFAADFPTNGTFSDVIYWIIGIFNLLVPLIIGAAIVVFLYGTTVFIAKAGDQEGRQSGRNFMLYGIIGIAVMVSVWGLVKFVTNTFGIPFGVPFLPSSTTNGGDSPNNIPNNPFQNPTVTDRYPQDSCASSVCLV